MKKLENIKGDLNATYEDKKMSFVVPETVEDMVMEGREMSNALQVGSFIRAVNDGKMAVVFMKRDGKSTADIAIVNGEIVHAVRKYNAPILPQDMEKIQRYAKDKGLVLKKNIEELLLEHEVQSVL